MAGARDARQSSDLMSSGKQLKSSEQGNDTRTLSKGPCAKGVGEGANIFQN